MSRALTPSIAAAITALGLTVAPPALAAPMVQIAQYPLTVAAPAHPQVLFALANSQSMDGNLSGAIMTGSGGLGAAFSGLNASTSPSTYIVPNGFTAPVSGATAGANAPYTVNIAGTLYDNSNSRLNVAKAGLQGILTTFLPNADFALIDYQTVAPGFYTTWVYYMSNPGGFTFSNTPAVAAGPWVYSGDGTTTSFGPLANASTNDAYEYIVTINGTVDNPLNYLINYTPPQGVNPGFYNIAFIAAPAAGATISLSQVSKYVPNPCYNIPLNGANTVNSDCTSLNGFYAAYQPINSYQYMMLQASSDDPLINDVLYAGGLPTIWVNYIGPSWPNPYTHYGLGNFETGGVSEMLQHRGARRLRDLRDPNQRRLRALFDAGLPVDARLRLLHHQSDGCACQPDQLAAGGADDHRRADADAGQHQCGDGVLHGRCHPMQLDQYAEAELLGARD